MFGMAIGAILDAYGRTVGKEVAEADLGGPLIAALGRSSAGWYGVRYLVLLEASTSCTADSPEPHTGPRYGA